MKCIHYNIIQMIDGRFSKMCIADNSVRHGYCESGSDGRRTCCRHCFNRKSCVGHCDVLKSASNKDKFLFHFDALEIVNG